MLSGEGSGAYVADVHSGVTAGYDSSIRAAHKTSARDKEFHEKRVSLPPLTPSPLVRLPRAIPLSTRSFHRYARHTQRCVLYVSVFVHINILGFFASSFFFPPTKQINQFCSFGGSWWEGENSEQESSKKLPRGWRASRQGGNGQALALHLEPDPALAPMS